MAIGLLPGQDPDVAGCLHVSTTTIGRPIMVRSSI